MANNTFFSLNLAFSQWWGSIVNCEASLFELWGHPIDYVFYLKYLQSLQMKSLSDEQKPCWSSCAVLHKELGLFFCWHSQFKGRVSIAFSDDHKAPCFSSFSKLLQLLVEIKLSVEKFFSAVGFWLFGSRYETAFWSQILQDPLPCFFLCRCLACPAAFDRLWPTAHC